jgi:pyruvate carboxylase
VRIRRLLIANRGEIAARVIRTCARLGIESVLAASDADLDALPSRLADRVVRLGPAPATASYLNPAAVVAAARERGLLLLACGLHGNVIRLLPPITIGEADLEEGLDALEAALREVAA